MKRGLSVLLTTILLLSGLLLLAEEDDNSIDMNLEGLEESLGELEDAIDEIEDIDKDVYIYFPRKSNKVKMGVFLADLDFQEAYEMHYDYNYGVMVTGVTENGPAEKAGIMKGDIIMSLDKEKARYEDHLVRMIKQKDKGQEGTVKFFRDGKIFETTIVFDVPTAKESDIDIKSTKTHKKKTYVGHGGGSWYPIWYMPELDELNSALANFGFKDETFSEDGFLIQGGGGMGHVGKGWFIGGMGAKYDNKETTKHEWAHYTNGIMDTATVSRKVKYEVGFGGVTLDKRFPIFKNFVGSLGFMIGWGEQNFKLSQVDDNGDISNFDFDSDISDQFDEQYDYKSKLSMKQEFILFQPKATFLYEILDWLHMRAEVGYMLSHSPDGWVARRNGEKIKVENAPDLNMDGLTISIGPWFGF